MAQVITAVIGSIDQIRQAIETQLELIEKNEDELEVRIKNLAGMWEGDAHETFQADMMNGLNALRDNTEKARNMAKFEGFAVNEYGTADADVEETINVM